MLYGVGIVGCGFVADFYAATLRAYAQPKSGPALHIAGVFDVDETRARTFADHHGVRTLPTLDALLTNPDVAIVVILTPPATHEQIALQALAAGKHVYLEKPAALTVEAIDRIADAAGDRRIAAAPCCVLGNTAQTLRKALTEGAAGTVRLAYAEMDDGPHHLMPTHRWSSASGAAWPADAERRVGCILQHAAYPVSWLTMLFGPVRRLTADAAVLRDDPEAGPDFGCALLRFDHGVMARLTCGTLAPRDRGLRLFGDAGVLSVDNCAVDNAHVRLKHYRTLRRRLVLGPWPARVKPVRGPVTRSRYRGSQARDFAAGIAELAAAIENNVAPRLGVDFLRHTTEVVLRLNDALRNHGSHDMRTSFDPATFPAMPWAR